MAIQQASSFALLDAELDLAPEVERNLKIFRVGTFTDMFGRTRTWTAEDLDRAVEHFQILRDQGVLPNIPVREDHSKSIKDVAGYLHDLRRDGNFLVADVEWAGEEYRHKWKTKKYRNRSVEIGQYVTNAGSKYDPVVLGLAFVDIPAVEGLYRIAEHGDDMGTNDTTPTAETSPASPEVTAPEAAEPVAPEAAEPAAPEAAATPEPTPEAPIQAPAPELVGAHGHVASPAFAFRAWGSPQSDYAAVQAHIDSLEAFQRETIQSSRSSFLEDLVTSRVITGPQAEQFRALVEAMDDTQFSMFRAGFEGAQPNSIYGRHDLSGDASNGSPGTDARVERIQVLEQTVQQHRYRGVSDEDLQKMGSYRELQELKSAKA